MQGTETQREGATRARDDIMLSAGLFFKTVCGVTERERKKLYEVGGLVSPRPPGGSEYN